MNDKRSRRDGKGGVAAFLELPAPRWQPGGVGPLWTVFTLTFRQFLRGRRALVILVLALLPAGLALLARVMAARPWHDDSMQIEFRYLFVFIPHTLLPLASLLYGSGLILDEQEDQTLTYLLIRPLPKWGLYLAKYLAAVCMVSLLGAVFVPLTFGAIYLGAAEWWQIFPVRKMVMTLGVMILTMTAYVAVFGFMSLFVQRSLIVGLAYIGLVEGVLSNFDFALRQLTMVYYLRVLAINWLDVDPNLSRAWTITTADAPSPLTCVLTLLTVAAVATAAAMYVFTRREFYVKTPETN